MRVQLQPNGIAVIRICPMANFYKTACLETACEDPSGSRRCVHCGTPWAPACIIPDDHAVAYERRANFVPEGPLQ